MSVPALRPVTPEEFSERLEKLLVDAGPAVGLFGPDSQVWRVTRHLPVYLLATPLGAYMDAAHPWVAEGVAQHSTIFSDPHRRARNTYLMLMRITFGDAETVRRTSRGLWSLHTRVEGQLPEEAARYGAGSPYLANEHEALLWVHLIFFWTRLSLYETLVGPLEPAARDQYVVESARFAACFGIDPDLLPETHDAFEALVEDMAARDLALTDAGRTTIDFLIKQVPRPARPVFLAFLVHSLPERVSQVLELPSRSRMTRALHGMLVLGLKATQRIGPRSTRYVPAYLEAQSRLGGPRVPRLSGRLSTALVGRSATLPDARD